MAGELFRRDAQMHLALPPHHHLVGLGVVDEMDRRVLVDELVQRLAELDVVLALFRGNRNGQHRRMRLDLGHRGMRLLAGRERVAGLGVFELAERDRLAGRGGAALLGGLAQELERAGHPAGLALRRQQRDAVADLAAQHAGDRHLAGVAGAERLQHIGERLVARDAEPLGGALHIGRLVAERLEQPEHAVGSAGDAHQHRNHEAIAQLLGEIVEHLVARRRDVGEQLLHQLVVVVGKLLQHGEARILAAIEILAVERHHLGGRMLLVDMDALQREIDEAGDDVVLPNRKLADDQRLPRGRLEDLQRLHHPGLGLVDLVEEQEARNVEVFELAQDQLKLRHLFLVGLAHHHRGVDRGQRRAHIVDEFNGAGAIDKSVAVAHEIGGGDGELDAHLVMARLLGGVADAGAGLHRALPLDRAGARQYRFEECGLAGLKWAHQRDAPGTLGSCAAIAICSRHRRLPVAPHDRIDPAASPDAGI